MDLIKQPSLLRVSNSSVAKHPKYQLDGCGLDPYWLHSAFFFFKHGCVIYRLTSLLMALIFNKV